MAGHYLFRDFVLLLHQRLVPIRRRIKFRAGLGWARFLTWLFFEGSSPVLDVNFVVVPLFPLYEGARLAFRRNRPRRYRPDRIPDFLLP